MLNSQELFSSSNVRSKLNDDRAKLRKKADDMRNVISKGMKDLAEN